MKVAVVVKTYPPEMGGGFTFSQSVIAALREIEPQTSHEFVYYSDGETDEPGVKVIPPPQPSDPVQPQPGLRRLAWSLREHLAPAPPPPPPPPPWLQRSLAQEGVEFVWFADNYALKVEIPYIFTVLDIEHLRQPWFPETSVDDAWSRRQEYFSKHIPSATRVIVPNDAGREQVLRNFTIDAERVISIPHPTPEFALDAAKAEPQPRDALARWGITEPYLLYPAQFWPHKNHVTALDALAELNQRRGESFDLVLVGSDKEGQLAHVKAVAAELGLSDRVRFTGFVSSDELVGLYQHAFALTYLSLFGPENLPPLEAMALGCPVIAADVPGAAEQLGDAALRVAPMDPAALADAVQSLNDAETRSRLTAAGRELAGSRTARGYVSAVVGFLDEFQKTRRLWS
ncbi:MAG: glycosyltransferase family 4 protein [Actinomycetota bacterium]|nr:glycosyltransferase family 4 protein [Actinomycetota bacterium]